MDSEPTTMTRFDAATPDERRKLFVEAIRAHRERASPFLTVETDPVDAGGSDEERRGGDGASGPGPLDEASGDSLDAGTGDPPFAVEGTADDSPDSTSGSGDDPGEGVPVWVQFADGVVNLDCTEGELDRLKDLLSEYPAFRIDEITRPDDAEGANVRVTARADANRIAGFVDDVFLGVYGRPADYRAWVVEV